MQDQHTKAIYKFNVRSIDLLEEHINLTKPNWLDDLASGDLNRQSDACRSVAQDIRKELSLSNDEILPDPFIADLCWRKASSSPSWKTKPQGRPRQHSSQLSLDFIFIDQKGDGNAILGKLIFERIDAQASTGRVYPALEMEGVHTDADWDGAVEAAIHHANANGIHIPNSSDLRWRVEIATGTTSNGKREYRVLRSGDKLLGRSAGVTFLLGLSYHFGSHSLDTRRAFQSILALAALPYKDEPDTSTLCDLGGQEEKKAEALELLQRSEPHIRRNVLLAARREHKLDSLKGCKERLAGKVAEIFRLLDDILREDRNSPRALDFDDYLQLKRKGFVGREWLFDEMDLWRFESEERALLITGDPGTGKTSLVAELIHRNPGGRVIGYHCCQSNEIETLRPGRFVQSLAAMIASHLPAYAELLNGEHLTRVLGDERCEKDPGGAFLEGVLQPLQKIPAPDCGVRYILVDALDEASGFTGQRTLPDILASHIQRFPAWLRLVATTRNEPKVMQSLGGLRAKQIDASDPRNRQDLTTYLDKRLREPSLAERLVASHTTADAAVQRISGKSSGNFLYAVQVLDGIAHDVYSLANLDALPRGLDGIYLDFFRRIFGHENTEAGEAAYQRARPLLRILCTALEPLTRAELADASQIDPEEELPQLLRKLTQLLTRQMRATGEETLTFHHKSVADWLTTHLDTNAFAVGPTEGRKLLAEFCRDSLATGKAKPDWYVRRHAVEHFLEVEDLDSATEALCDLEFIEARAIAQELPAMLMDYAQAAKLLPEGEKERQTETARQAELDRYAREMYEYAATWSRIRDGTNEEAPCLPRPVKSVRLWTEEEIAAERKRMTEAPNRLDRVKAFRVFVASNTEPLQQHATQEGFVANLARNDSPAGPVHEEGKQKLEPLQCIKLIKRFAEDDIYNPLPACSSIYEGHTADVCSVTLSADGRRAISGSNDKTLCVWDLESGECLKIIKGHSNWVRSVALSADGHRAISASADCTLRLWDLESGCCLKVFEGHTDWINSIALCVDGRVSRLRKPESSGQIKGHANIAGPVALSLDGGLAVSASADCTLRVWDLECGECINILKGHINEVNSVALSADGRLAVSGSEDKTLRCWDLESGECIKVLSGHTDWVNSVALSSDGRLAVSASADKTLRVWHLESGECIKVLHGHENMLGSVALSADGRRAISGSYDSTIRVWDLESGRCIRVFDGQSIWSINVALSADGRHAVSANHDNNLRLWDLERGECLKIYKSSRFVNYVTLSLDGCTAASASHKNNIRLWATESGKCTKLLKGHENYISSVTISHDGRRAISWAKDQTLRLWDINTGECLKIFEGHTTYVHSIALSPDGSCFVPVSADSIMRLWNFESGACTKVLEGHKEWIKSFAFSADGRRALSGSDDKTIRLWDLDSGKCLKIFVGHTHWVNSVAFSKDDRFAVSASADSTLRVWDIDSGKCLKVLVGHTGGVSSIFLSADGLHAVSFAWDRTLRVWNLESGECAARFFCRGLVSINLHESFYKMAVIFLNYRRPDFFYFENLPLSPLITTAQREIISEDLPAGPVTARPPCCGQLISIPVDLAERIEHWHLAGDERGDNAYNDPALLFNCSSCGTPLRMNPFFLDVKPITA